MSTTLVETEMALKDMADRYTSAETYQTQPDEIIDLPAWRIPYYAQAVGLQVHPSITKISEDMEARFRTPIQVLSPSGGIDAIRNRLSLHLDRLLTDPSLTILIPAEVINFG